MTYSELLGKKYPIMSVDNEEIVGYKIITNVIEIENATGCLVQLDNSSTGIVVPYSKCLGLLELNKE